MASPFPITIDKVALGYTRGSSDKIYNLVLIQAANGKKMLITRYGRRNTWGQMDIDYAESAATMFQKKLREKKGKGYEVERQAMNLDCGDFADLRRQLGDQYWNKLSAAQREHLLGENGGEPNFVAPASAASKPEPARPLTDAERYAGNARWGAF